MLGKGCALHPTFWSLTFFAFNSGISCHLHTDQFLTPSHKETKKFLSIPVTVSFDRAPGSHGSIHGAVFEISMDCQRRASTQILKCAKVRRTLFERWFLLQILSFTLVSHQSTERMPMDFLTAKSKSFFKFRQ